MKGNNEHTIKGNVGGDVQFKDFPEHNNSTVCQFSVATSNDYFDRDKKEWVSKEPTWHKVYSFSPTVVKKARDLRKGSYVMVSGQVVERKYTDDKQVERNIREIKAHSIDEIVRRANNDAGFPSPTDAGGIGETKTPPKESSEDEDPLPF